MNKLKCVDILICLLSLTSFLLLLIDNELVYRSNQGLKPSLTLVPLTLTNNILRLINIGITALPLAGLLIYRQNVVF